MNDQTHDEEVIDLVEITAPDGTTMWVTPDEQPLRTSTTTDVDMEGGDPDHLRPVSHIPREKFANDDVDPSEMASLIAQIREAEQGRNVPVPVVLADGKIRPAAPGRHGNVASAVPRERFAGGDWAVIQRLDPENQCGWRWFGDVKGWTFTLRPDVFSPSEYVFLARQEPSRRNEWFAYVIEPNLDAYVGHDFHLQSMDGQTVVCLRPGFRGHASLNDLHGALAKWCVHHEFIRRGLPAPFSE